MKFSIEVDIDWLEEQESLDNALRTEILASITNQIQKSFTESVGKQIAQDAESLVRAKTELLINTVLEKPVVISTAWNNKEAYDSIFDMVEQKMTALYEGKLNTQGQCKKDPLLTNIETYVTTKTRALLLQVDKRIKTEGAKIAKKTVEENALIKALDSILP